MEIKRLIKEHGVGFVAGVAVTTILANNPLSCEGNEKKAAKSSVNTPTTLYVPTTEGQSSTTTYHSETTPSPSSSEILHTNEVKAWTEFFGYDVKIPSPPKQLFDVLNTARKKGITSFEPHYIPKLKLTKNTDYPGWQAKPRDEFWQNMAFLSKAQSPESVSLSFGGIWVLVDTTKKGDNENGNPAYIDEQLSIPFTDPNQAKAAKVPFGTSRFYKTRNAIYTNELPALAKFFRIGKDMVRLPKALEYNVLGNAFYPEWGDGDFEERFDEEFGNLNLFGSAGRNPDGPFSPGGLTVIQLGPDKETSYIGFRPMIVFSS